MKKAFILLVLTIFSVVITNVSYAVDLGDIVGPDIIYKENNEIVGITDIISLYSAEGGFIYALEDEFTNYGHMVGDRKIVLAATDGIIEKTKEITVRVTLNKIPDIFKLVGFSSTQYYFVINLNKTASAELIAETLINLNQLTVIKPMQRQVITDTYTSNKEEPGTYELSFRILDASGSIKTINSSVKVVELSEDWDVFEPNTPQPWINIDLTGVWGVLGTIIGLIVLAVVIVILSKVISKFVKKYNKP